MIKLFGDLGSTCTRKVLTVLAETKTPFELTVVELAKGEHKQPAQVARQPFGQVPAINDDGFELYESRAICRYLSAKSESPLVPRELRQRALLDQWLSVEQTNFSPHAMKFVFHYVMRREQEASALELATNMLETCYGVMSQRLEGNEFLVGDQFTLADIGFMPYIEYMQLTPAKAILDKYPQVTAWWKRVSERPSWRKATGR